MNPDNKTQSERAQVVEIAKRMLSGEIDLIAGSRKLSDLRHAIGESENPAFFPIVGFESETDDYPVGEQRQQYDQNELKRLDKEMQDYIEQVKPAVLAACRRILERLEIRGRHTGFDLT